MKPTFNIFCMIVAAVTVANLITAVVVLAGLVVLGQLVEAGR